MAHDDGWMERAACRRVPDPDRVFFPPSRKGVRTDITEAQRICFGECEVRKTCLVYAVVHREGKGVWGGYSEAQRKKIPTPVKQAWRQVWYRVYPGAVRFKLGRR